MAAGVAGPTLLVVRTEVRAEQREAVGGDPSVEPAMAPRVPWRLLAWLVFPLAMLGVLVVAADGLVLRLDEPLAALVRGQGWLDALRPLNELGSETPWPGAATREENRVGVWLSTVPLGAHEPESETGPGAFPAPRIVATSTFHSVVDRLAPPDPL